MRKVFVRCWSKLRKSHTQICILFFLITVPKTYQTVISFFSVSHYPRSIPVNVNLCWYSHFACTETKQAWAELSRRQKELTSSPKHIYKYASTPTHRHTLNPVHILLPVGHEWEAMSTRCRASDLGNLLVLWDRSIGPQINWLHVRTIRLTWCCWGAESSKQPV